MSFRATNHFTIEDWQQFDALMAACEKTYGAAIKIYQNVLKNDREIAGNLFHYENGQMVGYLSFFFFEEGTSEISAMVHPDYRRRGIFKALYQKACIEIDKLGVNRVLFSCPQNSVTAHACFQRLNAQFDHAEYYMTREGTRFESVVGNPLKLREAKASDIELMTKIAVAAFNSHYFNTQDRFIKTIHEPWRQVWLAYLDNECIGKSHLRLDADSAFIHDVAIIPAQQRRGYGAYLLKYSINHLLAKGYTRICLEVEAANEGALQLYRRCGFELTRAYEFWAAKVLLTKL